MAENACGDLLWGVPRAGKAGATCLQAVGTVRDCSAICTATQLLDKIFCQVACTSDLGACTLAAEVGDVEKISKDEVMC